MRRHESHAHRAARRRTVRPRRCSEAPVGASRARGGAHAIDLGRAGRGPTAPHGLGPVERAARCRRCAPARRRRTGARRPVRRRARLRAACGTPIGGAVSGRRRARGRDLLHIVPAVEVGLARAKGAILTIPPRERETSPTRARCGRVRFAAASTTRRSACAGSRAQPAMHGPIAGRSMRFSATRHSAQPTAGRSSVRGWNRWVARPRQSELDDQPVSRDRLELRGELRHPTIVTRSRPA